MRIVFKLVFAALLGGLLGFEREASGKAAGLRTHVLVAMGAAMFPAIAQLLGVRRLAHEIRHGDRGSAGLHR
ncbi:MgtC/SapB family protein [Comamonas odontotermitis]|uniref:MgtC/SapB family protein n=1 Tax=Comamonas odontotermitis TaxID=379895 RepID=UPI00295E87DE|nr:MgtC/SapB family protein [Comamonas odontotermitis]